MSAYFLLVSDIVKRKVFWLAPLALSILVVVSRVFNYEFLNTLLILLGRIFASVFIFIGLRHIVPKRAHLVKQVMLYKSFGLSILKQFIIRLVFAILWVLALFFISTAVSWTFNINLLMLAILMCLSLLLFSALSTYLNNGFIYYVVPILYIASLFYTLYLIPNPAYIMHTNVHQVMLYSFIYGLFYTLVSYKLYIMAWRAQCIG